MATVAVMVLGGTGFVALRYVLRDHPGPRSLAAAVKAFKETGSIPAGKNVKYDSPAEGVYALAGQGTEHISFPPNSQRDGAVMPGSVTYLPDGCWRWHVDYNVAHWEEYDFCPRGAELLLAANRNFQAWDFGTFKISNLARFACPPATVVLPEDPKPGQGLGWNCTGTNTAVVGRSVTATTARIVGMDALRIGDTRVPTIHQFQQVTLTGGQRGTVREDWWFMASSGLPVRMARRITIVSSSPIGTVTYNEVGSWQMTSLQPQT